MNESTYLNFFDDNKLIRNETGINYGGINKSPLHILGTVTFEVRLTVIPNRTFILKFVSDSIMTYDILIEP